MSVMQSGESRLHGSQQLLVAVLLGLGGLLLWSSPNPHPPEIISVPAPLSSVCWQADGEGLWLGRQDGGLDFIARQSSKQTFGWELGTGRVSQLSMSPNGRWLAACVAGESLIVIDAEQNLIVRTLQLSELTRGCVAPNGILCALGTATGTVWLRELESDRSNAVAQHAKLVTALAFSPSGRYLASGSQSGTVQVWDCERQQPVLFMAEPHSTILGLCFAGRLEERLLIAHFDQTLTECDLLSGEKKRQQIGQSHTQGVAFTATGELWASVGRNGRVQWRAPFSAPVTGRYLGGPDGACTLRLDADTNTPVLAVVGERQLSVWKNSSWEPPVTDALLLPGLLLAVALTSIVAVQDWRWALMCCLVLDVWRDPVRKLLPDSPLWVTFSILPAWGAVVWRAWAKSPSRPWGQWPRCHWICATAAGLVYFSGVLRTSQLTTAAPQLITLGTVSYLTPLIALWLGIRYLRDSRDLYRFALWLCVANVVAVLTAGAEALRWDWRSLGGIDFDWIRYRTGGLLGLMSGWFRSPNLLGFHAVQLAVYGLIAATFHRRWGRTGWLLVAMLGLMGTLLAGRRKMVLILIVVGLALVCAGVSRFVRLKRRTLWIAILLFTTATAILGSMLVSDQGPGVSYVRYAGSLWTEGWTKAWGLTAATQETFRQNGPWGAGLGLATQGSYRWRHVAPRMWQEDGLSRVAAEFGWPGLILLLLAGLWLLQSLWTAVRQVAAEHRLRATLLAGLVLGHVASYLADHMTFSGDPSSALLAMLPWGFLMSLRSQLGARESSG